MITVRYTVGKDEPPLDGPISIEVTKADPMPLKSYVDEYSRKKALFLLDTLRAWNGKYEFQPEIMFHRCDGCFSAYLPGTVGQSAARVAQIAALSFVMQGFRRLEELRPEEIKVIVNKEEH